MERKTFATRPRRIALFVTCMVDMLYPDVGMATVDLLEHYGVEVIFPADQTCCGQPAFNAGFRDEARTMARHFLDVFAPLLEAGTVDALVAPSGSCTSMVRHFYPELFEGAEHAAERARAELVGAACFELTEFLVDVLGVTAVDARVPARVAYHASCHLSRELGVDRQPRQLLASVQATEHVELPGGDECCGFGGLFAIKNAAISEAMGRTKTQNIAASGADLVALCDVSCMAHINGMLSRQGQHVRAVHIAQLLTGEAGALMEADTPESVEPPASVPAAVRTEAQPPAQSREPTRPGSSPSPAPPASDAPPARPRRWQDIG
jgi:L-lactate dehydrogenase complex protein LldE